MPNYRKIYKKYFDIDFGKEYDIHHMDGDRENNDISNLLLLPKKLHLQYHFYKKIIDDWDKNTAMDKVSCNTYLLNAFTRFSEICFDCMQYVKIKKYMEKGFDPVGRIDGITRLKK